jgi:hypothetical protein
MSLTSSLTLEGSYPLPGLETAKTNITPEASTSTESSTTMSDLSRLLIANFLS